MARALVDCWRSSRRSPPAAERTRRTRLVGGGGRRAAPSRARASRRSRSAPRTSPRSSSSASSTSRRCEAKGYTVNLKKNIGADRDHRHGADERRDRRLSRVHRRVAVARWPRRDDPAKTAAEEYAQLAKQFYEGRGQTVSNPTPFQDVDAIATTKAFASEERADQGRGPQEARQLLARRATRVQEPPTGSRGHEEGLRDRQRQVPAARAGRAVPGAGHGQGRHGEHLHDGRAARERASTRCSRTPRASSASRTSAFVIDKNKLAAARWRSEFMNVINGGQQAPDDRGDHRDEQGGRARQTGRGHGGQAVPRGQ